MKTIGLLGGVSWQSTLVYYERLNRLFHDAYGGNTSARIVMHSFNFQEIAELQKKGDWERLGALFEAAADGLVNSGAEVILICANTMHLLAPRLQAHVNVPILHIADETGKAILKADVATVGLLGTRYTMEMPFFVDRLQAVGVEVLIPDEAERADIHRVIYEELCNGIVSDASRKCYLDIMARLELRGATGIVLGCTEIGMLLSQEHSALPLFDTTTIHCDAAFAFAR